MSKLSDLLDAAREKSWMIDNQREDMTIKLTRDCAGGTEFVDLYLTEHTPPRMHHAWYTLGENYDARYDSSQILQLQDRVTDPAWPVKKLCGWSKTTADSRCSQEINHLGPCDENDWS